MNKLRHWLQHLANRSERRIEMTVEHDSKSVSIDMGKTKRSASLQYGIRNTDMCGVQISRSWPVSPDGSRHIVCRSANETIHLAEFMQIS